MFDFFKDILRSAGAGAKEIKKISSTYTKEVKLGLARGGVILLSKEEENQLIEELIIEELYQQQPIVPPNPSIPLLDKTKTNYLSTNETLTHLKRLKRGSLEYILGHINGKLIIQDLHKEPHLIIGGKTGSGKTVTMFNILVSLVYSNTQETLKLSLIDPKILTFGDRRILNSSFLMEEPSIGDTNRALEILKNAYENMLDRYRAMQDRGVKDYKKIGLYSHVIFIDEIYELVSEKKGKEILTYITKIASLGRQAGVHLVLATQSIRAEILSGSLKANINPLAHQVSNQTESNIIGIKNCHKLKGNGHGLKRLNGSNELVEFQSTYIDIEDDNTYQFFRPESETIKTITKTTENNNIMGFIKQNHQNHIDQNHPQNMVNLGLESNITETRSDIKEMEEKILLSVKDGKVGNKKNIININSRSERGMYDKAIKSLMNKNVIHFKKGSGYFLVEN